jgi:hypothetical protein
VERNRPVLGGILGRVGDTILAVDHRDHQTAAPDIHAESQALHQGIRRDQIRGAGEGRHKVEDIGYIVEEVGRSLLDHADLEVVAMELAGFEEVAGSAGQTG